LRLSSKSAANDSPALDVRFEVGAGEILAM
jgi:hypothetical protein